MTTSLAKRKTMRRLHYGPAPYDTDDMRLLRTVTSRYGLTQQALADLTLRSMSTVTRWLHDGKVPGPVRRWLQSMLASADAPTP